MIILFLTLIIVHDVFSLKDCRSENNKLAGIISCGVVVRDASVILYDSPNLCCQDKLRWVPEDVCVGKSINVETGWLQDMIEDLTD